MSTLRASATSGSGRLQRVYLRWRYTLLFYSLLLTFAAGPLLNALGFDTNLLGWFLAVNILAAATSIGSRKMRRLFLTIVIAALVVRSGAAWFDYTVLSMASLATWTVVALGTAANSLRFALGATAADREHLYAALSAYVLAGLFCGVCYWILEQAWPGSLGSAGESVLGGFSLTDAFYFSFVTLATLGYGDIVPRSEVARGLAIVEAVAGQLYLAAMIAYLANHYIPREQRGGKHQ